MRVMAQAPVAGFSAPTTVCRQEQLALQNTSTSADVYAWDFCLNDISTPTSITDLVQPATLNSGFTLKTVWDQGNWYAFVTSVNNNHLIRLDFGNDLNNFPTVVDLGSPGTFFLNPEGFDVMKVGANWHAFVGHLDFGKGITRLDFGSSLQNVPTASYTGDLVAVDTRLREVKLLKQGSNLVLLMMDYNNNSVVRVNYGSSFLNVITPADVHTDVVTGSSLPLGLDIVMKGTNWIAHVASKSSNQIIQLNFGIDIFSTPSVDGTYTFSGLNQPTRIKLFREGANYYTIVSNETGAITVVDSKDLNPANAPSEITYPSIPALLGLDAFRSNGRSIIYGVGSTDNKIKRIIFETACDASSTLSTTTNPSGVSYSAAGAKKIELIATRSSTNESSVAGRSVTVTGNTSPDISFTSQFSCAQNNINFISTNVSGDIISYAWDFGDSQNSASVNPSHIYTTGANYPVRLVVTAGNGCTNFSSSTLPVYNPPVANFNMPSASPVCTSQNYLFVNTSIVDVGSSPSWEWRVNGTLVSSQQDLNSLFSSPVAQTIKLKALIPGCENEITKNIATVLTGPAINFSSVGNCSGGVVTFTNTSTGIVDAGYSWNFGDASTSTATSPAHAYAAAANYQVTLIGSNSAGCHNSQTKQLAINSTPQPDFSIGAPPFSCSNVLTPFQNNTPVLTDSNITGWVWQFNDPAAGTSSQQNPSYTFASSGTYNVNLQASTDAGCVNSVTKPVTISQSPIADFSVGPSCLNLPTKFTDLSSGSVQSRSWQIGPATFTTQNPTYTFASTGNFPATLTVNSSNGCTSVKAKSVIVPVPPTLNFTATNLCATKDAIFTDVTSSPQDVVAGWNWNFDGNAGTGNPATFNFASAGSYNVKMTTTHASGCKYTLSKNVSVNTSPIASFTASPDTGEPPLTVKFTNTSQQAASYVWKFYDRTVSTSTSVSPVYTFVALGDYSVQLTATNSAGCSDVITTPIKVLVPSIDLALTNLSLVIDPLTAKFRAVVTIRNNGNIPVSFADVSLILSDKAVVNETIPIDLSPGISVTKTLSFTVAPDANPFLCAEINSEKDVQPGNNKQCITFDSGDYFFNPYPNPTAGPVQVDWMSSVAGTSRVAIHDNMGRKVFDWQTPAIAGLNRATLDLSLFQTGLYYITIETGKSKKTTRLLIQ
jgi:PKD repeat protein